MNQVLIALGSIAALLLAVFTWSTCEKRAIRRKKEKIAELEKRIRWLNYEIIKAKQSNVSDSTINSLDRERMRILSELRSLRQELEHYE